MSTKDVHVTLRLSRDEWEELHMTGRQVMILPFEPGRFDEKLTTGKLGNSNRVMLPKKVLEKHSIDHLPKKADSGVFEFEGGKFLVIKLKETSMAPPRFGEE